MSHICSIYMSQYACMSHICPIYIPVRRLRSAVGHRRWTAAPTPSHTVANTCTYMGHIWDIWRKREHCPHSITHCRQHLHIYGSYMGHMTYKRALPPLHHITVVNTCIYMCVCTYVCIHMYVCMHATLVYVCMYVCMHIYIYIYIYIYIHQTHTNYIRFRLGLD